MIDLREYGWDPALLPRQGGGVPARVTAVHKERYGLICEAGECFGRLKASVYYRTGHEDFPTVGDFVLIRPNPSGDCQITKTLPRRSFFARRDPYPGRLKPQAVAANFDTVLLVQSLNENFNLSRLQRYLVQARQSGGEPVIVLTKCDLPGEHGPLLKAAQEVSGGAPVCPVSAKTGEGLALLDPWLQPGRTLALLGSSGVGKSSLINRLAGEELMATGEIREQDGRGRHTTTHRQLLRLPSGALVIDTPGMRELGLWDVSAGIRESFEDVERLIGQCRFSNCRHETEPGCAVREALQTGALSPERWKSYQSLKEEAAVSRPKRKRGGKLPQ